MNKQNRKDLGLIQGVLGSIRQAMEDAEPGTVTQELLAEWEGTIDNQVGELEGLKDEEQEKFDNMPESLQQGEKGQAMEQAVSDLEEAITTLEGASVTLSKAKHDDKSLPEELSGVADEISEACDKIDEATSA